MRKIWIRICLTSLFLTACGSPEQTQELPTLVPLDAPLSTPAAEASQESIPPTEAGRPTLPPSWTPTFTETPLPTLTPTFTETPVIAVNTPDNRCEGFTYNRQTSTSTFQIGQSPFVEWTPVAGAVRYWVILTDDRGVIVKGDIYTADTFHSFDPTFFEQNRQYGWTVAPINQDDIQMCIETGGDLVPVVPQP